MNDIVSTSIKDRVIACHRLHPDWTARQIAEDLGVERYHVYNYARAAGLTLAAAPAVFPARPAQLPAVTHGTAPDGLPVADFTVFADSPAGMIEAQSDMVAWCDDKIAAAAIEQEDAQKNAFDGAGSGFKTDAWDKRARDIGRRIDFYEKVKAALQAGYYIVPPFPINVFAIRTKAVKPRGDWSTDRSAWAHRQSSQVLPSGEGRYVSPTPTIESVPFDMPKPGGDGVRAVTHYKPHGFVDVVDFPFRLARAEVMNATAAAMALKIFDQVGVLPGGPSPDPIVCGQILMPHHGKSPLTFFVTWWLDTKTL